ncbi:ATP-binding cassette domain-containing protein [Pseudomonas aeruginosa]
MLYMKCSPGTTGHQHSNLERRQDRLRRIGELAGQFLLLAHLPGKAIPLRRLCAWSESNCARCAPRLPTIQEGGHLSILGPLDLTIRRGKSLFVVGENGCGKTTLDQAAPGSIRPHSRRNPPERQDCGRRATRRLPTKPSPPSSPTTHLFDELLRGRTELPAEAHRSWSAWTSHTRWVSWQLAASPPPRPPTGQRKRLALINAWLDDRPVLVFDEWAADQDPAFRRVFYTELLPELKTPGRTLIVISHDDRYFDIADKLVHMHAGRLWNPRCTPA